LTRKCRITDRKEGSFHHCVCFRIDVDDVLADRYVLKIPAHGTDEHWQEGDAFMLRNEATLIQHTRHHTKCPVPEVIAFDATLDNAIGAPYILMKKLKGMSASDMWQGLMLPNPPKYDKEYMNADEPHPVLEALRVNILKSLASAMVQLQTLEFDSIGIPVLDRPEDAQPSSIGPAWRWHSKLMMQKLNPIGPFKSSKQFFDAGLVASWDENVIVSEDRMRDYVAGLAGTEKLLKIILDSPPFATFKESLSFSFSNQKLERKPFVLRHDDLDLQNIMVDDDGNLTGIIDWDGCMTVPRCVG